MILGKLFSVILLLAGQTAPMRQDHPRAISSFSITSFSAAAGQASVSKSASSTSQLPCCYIEDLGVGQVLWYTSSIEATVATISTVVYQYNHTAITSYTTITGNSTVSLPTGTFQDFDTSISGVPRDIIGANRGSYPAASTIIYGTEFTDPYGVVYTSPTRVWMYTGATYITAQPTTAFGGIELCPFHPGFSELTNESKPEIKPYPSGFFIPDVDPINLDNGMFELLQVVPYALLDYMISHVPPNASSIWSSLDQCRTGIGDGVATAHIPVNQLTVNSSTTSTINRNHEVVPTTATPLPSTTESDSLPISTLGVSLNAARSTSTLGDPLPVPQTPRPSTPLSVTIPIFTAGTSTITGDQSSNFIIGSSTLTPGGTIVVSGSGLASPTTFIFPVSGNAIAINSNTQEIVGSSTYTANQATEFVIGGKTLTKGGVITASGETLSLAPGGSSLVIMSGTSTKTKSLGGVIISLGGVETTPSKPVDVKGSSAHPRKLPNIRYICLALATYSSASVLSHGDKSLGRNQNLYEYQTVFNNPRQFQDAAQFGYMPSFLFLFIT